MTNVGCHRDEIVPFHQLPVCKNTQVEAVPEGGFPYRRGKIMRHGHVLEETRSRLNLVDGLRIQANAGPQQERMVVAQAHIHALWFYICKQFRILAQSPPIEQAKRLLSLLESPDVGGARRQYGQRSLCVEQ